MKTVWILHKYFYDDGDILAVFNEKPTLKELKLFVKGYEETSPSDEALQELADTARSEDLHGYIWELVELPLR